MSTSAILQGAIILSLLFLSLSFLLTAYRVVRGPSLPDRVLALDMLVSVAIGFIAVIAIKTGYALYVDIAIALGLVGFLATVAFARFILTKGTRAETIQAEVEEGDTPLGLPGRGGRRLG